MDEEDPDVPWRLEQPTWFWREPPARSETTRRFDYVIGAIAADKDADAAQETAASVRDQTVEVDHNTFLVVPNEVPRVRTRDVLRALNFGPCSNLVAPLPLNCALCFDATALVCRSKLHRFCCPQHRICGCHMADLRDSADTTAALLIPACSPACAVCGAEPSQRFYCPDCRSVSYCSERHREAHRVVHKIGHERLAREVQRGASGTSVWHDHHDSHEDRAAAGTVSAEQKILNAAVERNEVNMLRMPTCDAFRASWQARREWYVIQQRIQHDQDINMREDEESDNVDHCAVEDNLHVTSMLFPRLANPWASFRTWSEFVVNAGTLRNDKTTGEWALLMHFASEPLLVKKVCQRFWDRPHFSTCVAKVMFMFFGASCPFIPIRLKVLLDEDFYDLEGRARAIAVQSRNQDSRDTTRSEGRRPKSGQQQQNKRRAIKLVFLAASADFELQALLKWALLLEWCRSVELVCLVDQEWSCVSFGDLVLDVEADRTRSVCLDLGRFVEGLYKTSAEANQRPLPPRAEEDSDDSSCPPYVNLRSVRGPDEGPAGLGPNSGTALPPKEPSSVFKLRLSSRHEKFEDVFNDCCLFLAFERDLERLFVPSGCSPQGRTARAKLDSHLRFGRRGSLLLVANSDQQTCRRNVEFMRGDGGMGVGGWAVVQPRESDSESVSEGVVHDFIRTNPLCSPIIWDYRNGFAQSLRYFCLLRKERCAEAQTWF